MPEKIVMLSVDADREVISTQTCYHVGTSEERLFFRVMPLHASSKVFYETRHDYDAINQ